MSQNFNLSPNLISILLSLGHQTFAVKQLHIKFKYYSQDSTMKQNLYFSFNWFNQLIWEQIFLFVYYRNRQLILRLETTFFTELKLILALEPFRYTVRYCSRDTDPAQGFYLHRTTQHGKMRTCFDEGSKLRSKFSGGQRQRGHFDRLILNCNDRKWCDGETHIAYFKHIQQCTRK